MLIGTGLSAHEFRHALHHEKLGGLWGAHCPDPHYVHKPSNYKCALQEGIADYLGDIGSPRPEYRGWERTSHATAPAGRVEAEIEGNVAALFHDLNIGVAPAAPGFSDCPARGCGCTFPPQKEGVMVRLVRRFPLLFLAVSPWACAGENRCSNSGITEPSAPEPPLYGTWEGREAPRVLGEPSPSWRFELESATTPNYIGMFATNRAIIEDWIHADTLRGPVTALHCRSEHEMDFEFELRYPTSSNPGGADYYVYPCTISGKLQGGNWRIDGVLACRHHTDENRTEWRAIYLIRRDGNG